MIYGLESLIERSFEKLGNNRAGRVCRGGDAGHLAEEDLNSAQASVLANETEK